MTKTDPNQPKVKHLSIQNEENNKTKFKKWYVCVRWRLDSLNPKSHVALQRQRSSRPPQSRRLVTKQKSMEGTSIHGRLNPSNNINPQTIAHRQNLKTPAIIKQTTPKTTLKRILNQPKAEGADRSQLRHLNLPVALPAARQQGGSKDGVPLLAHSGGVVALVLRQICERVLHLSRKR